MTKVKPVERPLSPHLTIYRPQMTSVSSILTRISGNALIVAAVLIVWWLLAAATGPGYFAHLYFDTGHGLDVPTAERLGWACVIGSVVLTVITIVIV